MSTRLVILGLLREHPMYGYEIKQEIEHRMGDWTSIAFGSIYFALNKLEQEKLIQKIAIEQDGNRPSRSVYQVTEAGQTKFHNLVRELWSSNNRQYYDIDLALYFLEAIPREDVLKILQTKINDLQKALLRLETHRLETFKNPYVPPLANSIFEHSYVHFQTEVDWLIDLRKKVANKEI